jgi:hypothetical protein
VQHDCHSNNGGGYYEERCRIIHHLLRDAFVPPATAAKKLARMACNRNFLERVLFQLKQPMGSIQVTVHGTIEKTYNLLGRRTTFDNLLRVTVQGGIACDHDNIFCGTYIRQCWAAPYTCIQPGAQIHILGE